MQYEYLTRRIDHTSAVRIAEDINGWGRMGWELVSVLPDRTYIFKRPLPEKVVGPSEVKEAK